MRWGLQDRRTMGEWLAKMRDAAGYTQEQAAEKMGMSRVQIARWETGTSRPDWDNTQRIADAYALSVDEVRLQCGYSKMPGDLSTDALCLARRYDRMTMQMSAERRKAFDRALDYMLSDSAR